MSSTRLATPLCPSTTLGCIVVVVTGKGTEFWCVWPCLNESRKQDRVGRPLRMAGSGQRVLEEDGIMWPERQVVR